MTLPKSPSYLLRRPSGYYFRFAFPAHLRPLLGCEVRRALCTADVREARRKASALAATVSRFCEQLKQQGLREDMRDELRQRLDAHLRDELRMVESHVATRPATTSEAASIEAETVETVAGEMREALHCRDYTSAEKQADILAENWRLDPPMDPQEFRQFCRELLKVNIQLTEHQALVLREGTADEDLLSPTPSAQTRQPEQPSVHKKPDGPRFSELLPKYLRERTAKGLKDSARHEYEQDLGLWVAVTGDPPISEETITPDLMLEAVEKVKRLPPNRNKGTKKGKTLDELLAMGLEPISDNTYRKYMTRLSEFFNWVVQRRHMSYSPIKGLMPRKQGDAHDERGAYADSELQRLFDPALYLTATDPREKRTPYRYWVPLLAMMTGARLGEVAGLMVNDLAQTPDGTWIAHFRDNDQGRSLKNGNSRRTVPLHPRIIELGFPEYVAELQRMGHQQLFPDVTPYRGSWSHHPSNWFGRYKKKAGITEKGKAQHAFRHTLVTRLHHARLRESEIAQMVGHARQGETMGRYAKDLPPELLAALTTALDYPIDWEGLKDGWRPMMANLPRPRRAATRAG